MTKEWKKGEQLSEMIVLVTNAFRGKFDKGGKPYVMHCAAVMNILNSDDEELNCIAFGHDLIEDIKDATYQMLRDMGFTERVIAGIRDVTKVPGESKEEYRAKVLSNPDARKVKKADLTHNSDIRRLKGIREKDIQRMVDYHTFYLMIEEEEKKHV